MSKGEELSGGILSVSKYTNLSNPLSNYLRSMKLLLDCALPLPMYAIVIVDVLS